MKIIERYNKWSDILENYKKYLMDDDEVWNNKYDELIDFFEKKKKRPSITSKNKEEKILGYWVSTNNHSYKNKTYGMKIIERYNKWTDILEKYKEYFNMQNKTQNETTIPPIQSSPPIPTQITKKTIKIKSMKLKEITKRQNEHTIQQKHQQTKTILSTLHQKYKTMNSSNLNQLFKENQNDWNTYHEISEENEKTFPENQIPRNQIIQELSKIKTKRTKIVVDMGCGKAQISTYFKDDSRFTFINYDHVSINQNTIISCDISKIPLENNSVEICILSLAMWGSNCKEYIYESNRILESNGKLYIIEPTKRWSEKDELGNIIPNKEGQKLKILLEENGFKIVEQTIEKFTLFVCIKM
jgi:hypothetical protein